MKHLFTLFFIFILGVQIQAQETLINETFETGWTAGGSALGGSLGLTSSGVDHTFTIANEVGNGAASSNFFGKMNNDGGSGGWAYIQKVVQATAGDEFEYTIALKPDIAGDSSAYFLTVIDVTNNTAVTSEVTLPWTKNWKVLTISYTAEKTVSYAFRLTKKYGVGNTGVSFDNISLTVVRATASVSDVNDFQFNIYPNPAKDVISFQSELPLERVEIFSLTGSKVLSQSNNVEQVEVGNLAKGIYMLKASAADGKVATQKLIKE